MDVSHELGRYRKKVDDQKKEIARLKQQLADCQAVIRGLGADKTAFAIAMIQAYGTSVMTDMGVELSRNLTLPRYDAAALLREFEVMERIDGEAYLFGIVKR